MTVDYGFIIRLIFGYFGVTHDSTLSQYLSRKSAQLEVGIPVDGSPHVNNKAVYQFWGSHYRFYGF